MQWSAEAIALTWELVEDFTPSLGLSDRDAVTARKNREREDNLIDLLSYLIPDNEGRMFCTDLYRIYTEWFPDDSPIKSTAIGIALKAVTGIESRSISVRGKKGAGYKVFRLPTAEEEQGYLRRITPSKEILRAPFRIAERFRFMRSLTHANIKPLKVKDLPWSGDYLLLFSRAV